MALVLWSYIPQLQQNISFETRSILLKSAKISGAKADCKTSLSSGLFLAFLSLNMSLNTLFFAISFALMQETKANLIKSEPYHEKTCSLHTQISCAVTAQLISVIVFAI